MEILQTKIKLLGDNGKFRTTTVEAISVFNNSKLERQGLRGKSAQMTMVLPDEWVEKMILHTVGSRESDHQFLLMKIPRETKDWKQCTPKGKPVKKKAKAAKKITSRKERTVKRV